MSLSATGTMNAALENPALTDGSGGAAICYNRQTNSFVTNQPAFYEVDEVATIGVKFSADDPLFLWLQEDSNRNLGLHAWMSDDEESPLYSLKVDNRPIPSAFTYAGNNTYIVSFVMKELFSSYFPTEAFNTNAVSEMGFMLFGYDIPNELWFEYPTADLLYLTKPYTGTKTYSGNFVFGIYVAEGGGSTPTCEKNTTTKFWMHYMPWFADKETNGFWNHWNNTGSYSTNPDIMDGTGKRQIASHYYPLIGTYSTKDRIALEYHLLLMKYSGIDGLLIDWYGTRNLWDFPVAKESADAIVEVLQEVGLQFAIVYEDWTAEANGATSQMVQNAKNDLLYCQNNYFGLNNHIKIEGKPLFTTFGPRNITTPSQWTDIFSALNKKPFFMPLIWHSYHCENYSNPNVDGEFQWTDASTGDYAYNISYLKNTYTHYIASAHPGFRDCYLAGGASSYPVADHLDGNFLKNRLQLAKSYNPPYIQLATWNDYGEGTMIEPTREFGYTFLNIIQQHVGLSCYTSVLPEIYRYFDLRKKYKNNTEKENKLKQAFDYFVAMQPEDAIEILNELDMTNVPEEIKTSNISFSVNNGTIYLSGLPAGKKLLVYDVFGRIVYQITSTQSDEIISGLNNGVYVISVDNNSPIKVLNTK